MKSLKFWMLAAILFCGIMSVQAQVMKTADLEKYAKQRYGDKWVDAAANIAKGITLDKNESITFQQVIEAPGKTKEQLYVALNYWTTATFKDHNAITLNDKDAGTVQNYEILSDISGGWLTAVLADERTVGDSKRKADDKTNANLYDKQWEIARHYPFVQNDAQKRTCAKALVMTHAYSNAVIDKIEEAVKNGIVGNEDEDW